MITIDRLRESAFVDAVEVHLTGNEWDTVLAFINRPGEVIGGAALEDLACLSRGSAKTYIRRLRRKLGDEVISTNIGHGYIWEVPAAETRPILHLPVDTPAADVRDRVRARVMGAIREMPYGGDAS